MARETKEQRLACEEATAMAAFEEELNFRANIQKFLFDLKQLATEAGALMSMDVEADGFTVSFEHADLLFEETLHTADTEMWMFESTKRALLEIIEAKKARATRLELAKKALEALTEEERAALKEFNLV